MPGDNVTKDIQVIIPYNTLVGLLEAPKRMEEVMDSLKRLTNQVQGVRRQIFEVVERLGDLQK